MWPLTYFKIHVYVLFCESLKNSLISDKYPIFGGGWGDSGGGVIKIEGKKIETIKTVRFTKNSGLMEIQLGSSSLYMYMQILIS